MPVDDTAPELCVRTPALEAGSDAHYTDPGYYSDTYADRELDVAYYQGLVSALPPKRRDVLEYGCGNGRIALPLAQIGATVTAVDRSKPMLDDFKRRLDLQPTLRSRITIRERDMRKARFATKFQTVICAFNTFLNLYTRKDVEAFLGKVRHHMRPRGQFIVDISVPDPEELSRDSGRAYRVPRFKHPTSGQVVRYAERFDYDPLAQVLTVGMEFEPVKAKKNAWMTPLAHRQFFPQDMEALLHYNGLTVTDIHADYEHKTPDEAAETLVYHCKKRGR